MLTFKSQQESLGGLIVTVIKMGGGPTGDHEARIRCCNTWSQSDPLSLFTHDDRDVCGKDSLVSTWLWTKEETVVLWNGAQLMLRQLRQEMGVDVGSWHPNSAVWGFFIFFYFPQSLTHPAAPAVRHTYTHISKPTTLPGPLSPGGESVISTNLFQSPP